MHDFIGQLLSYVKGTWRYRWYILLVAWIAAIPGWIFVKQLPDQFEASARVYVDTDSMLRPLLRGLAVRSDVSHRVRLMTRTLLSRPNLEKVARMTDLDIQAKTPEQMESLLDELGNNVKISATRRQANLYTISYEHDNPDVAKRVVQALLTIFVESTLGETRQDSDAAQKFLGKQIKSYEEELVKAEDRVMQFKREHMAVLRGGDLFSQLQAAMNGLEQAKLQVEEARYRRDEVKRQLEDSEPSESLLAGVQSPVTTSVDARIQALKARLDELSLKYTENHPDIRETKRIIAVLEKERQEELAAMQGQGGGLPETDPVRQQLRLSLGEADANLAAAKARIQEYKNRVNQLQQFVHKQPEIEAERKRLNRDYAILKQNYDKLVARREAANLAEQAEQTGDDVKFRVIDPPRVPLNPSGPNRPLFMSLVFLGSLGGGIVLAFLMSQVRPTFDSRQFLHDATGLPVLGSVSMIWTPQQKRKRRLEFAGFAVTTMLFLAAYVVVLVSQLPYTNLLKVSGIG